MRWLLAFLSIGMMAAGLALASDVRDPPPIEDPSISQWAKEVSRRFNVLTVTNRTPHGRITGQRGHLIAVVTSTNKWYLFINTSPGTSTTTNWAEWKSDG